MLLLVFALAVDIGGLQLERLRLHYALDLATLAAATSVDRGYYNQTGVLRLDPAEATPAAREFLTRNLVSLPDTPNPEQIATNADIVIVNDLPGRDPFNGNVLDRPSVCARIQVPHRFQLLGLVGIGSSLITITSESEVKR
jgi:hypothetical protein